MYDPLVNSNPGQGEPYPSSYWAQSLNLQQDHNKALEHDIDCDVAIIGGGYAGLSCAYHLAKYHNIHAVVLEANQSAWGCSGRNAGFILPSSGRLSFGQMQAKWGEKVMRGIYDEMQAGVATIEALIEDGIDCDKQDYGYLKVAHKPRMMKSLLANAELQRKMFGYDLEVLTRSDVHHNFMADQNAHGAVRFKTGFGLNPLKLAKGYEQVAIENGAQIFSSTPVLSVQEHNAGHTLRTPKATVEAKKVVLATNGYTPKGFHPLVNNKSLPVLSQIIVTQPLTDKQLSQINFITSNVVMDTRALKYYYRKLPDNRILFGGRGAITGKGAEDRYYADRLLKVLKTSFPSLAALRYDYAWAGWISVSLDDIPHIYQNERQDMFYSAGYCGSGVSFTAQAGKRLADKVAEKPVPDLPIYQTPLPTFPFAPLRRIGQWGYFQYGRIKDAYF